MNTNQIEILKLGSIVTTKQANNLRRLNIVCDGGPTFDYYRNLIIKNTSDIFEFYDTSKIFVCGPIPYNNHQRLIGISDSPPMIGHPFTVNNQSWHSSRVVSIIENCIIITKNSVYAIHDSSLFRDQKLTELGI